MEEKTIMVTVRNVWFPDFGEMCVVPRENTNYLYSLWVGLTAPVLNLPRMLIHRVVLPPVFGLITVLAFTATSVIAGVTGRAAGVQIVKDAE